MGVGKLCVEGLVWVECQVNREKLPGVRQEGKLGPQVARALVGARLRVSGGNNCRALR